MSFYRHPLCEKKFFGPSNQYLCHCRDSCEDDGNCIGQSGQCEPGWFGLRCQYQDVAVNSKVEPSEAVAPIE
ncbi:hypothetical protein Btru_058740 [Bulinus truncatus]|nr:hypothetical protein Btru_058740 [Bulinus truncatus]